MRTRPRADARAAWAARRCGSAAAFGDIVQYLGSVFGILLGFCACLRSWAVLICCFLCFGVWE